MWLTHLRRETVLGPTLARWDWRSRYLLITFFLALGIVSLATGAPLRAPWLAWKVVLFAGVLACGIGIRFYIAAAYRAWPRIWAGQGSAADEALVRSSMRRGTYVLWTLWALLLVIGWLGAVKPA
jgi:hypothetical protein